DAQVGAVGSLSLAGSETPIIEGLGKVVGVLALGGALFISVQNEDEVLRADPSDGRVTAFAVGLEEPDLLAAGPDGSIFAGARDGSVSRIEADGSFTKVVTGLQEVRGVAWDDAGQRLFVAEHDPDESDGVTHAIRVYRLAE
ncbi:MAG: hypothetical protein KC636_16900, partial [Myxococcales bacterium]|nr:hypothetical protein [Myxococcales bacterium]